MMARERDQPPPAARVPDAASRGFADLLRGFGALLVSSLGAQAIAFVALVIVSRRIGPSNIGRYSFATGIATYLALFANLGVAYRATRDVSQQPTRARQIGAEVIAIQLVACLVLYAAVWFLSGVLLTDQTSARVLRIVALMPIATLLTADWLLLGLAQRRVVALWRFIGQAVYGALVPILVVAGVAGLYSYAWLNVVGLGITAIGCGAAAVIRTGRQRSHMMVETPSRRALLSRVRISLPFAYSLIMLQVYGSVDVVLLGYLRDPHAVGIYAIANKLPTALFGIAGLWLNAFFPHAASRLQSAPLVLTDELARVLTAAIFAAAAVCIAGAFGAPWLIHTMFGQKYHEAITPMILLIPSGAAVLIEVSCSNVLLASSQQRLYLQIITAIAALTVIITAVLIKAFGTIGAATATSLGEIALAVLTYFGARRVLPSLRLRRDWLMAGVPVLAVTSGIMALGTLSDHRVIGLALGITWLIVAALFVDRRTTQLLSRRLPPRLPQ